MSIHRDIDQRKQRVAKLEREVSPLMRTLQLEHKEKPVVIDAKLVTLLRKGRKIEAIRLYKEITGCSLREAKDHVESLEA